MAFVKAELLKDEKQDFQKFCKGIEKKEAEVVRKAIRNYMAQHAPQNVTLTIQKIR